MIRGIAGMQNASSLVRRRAPFGRVPQAVKSPGSIPTLFSSGPAFALQPWSAAHRKFPG